MRVGIMTYHNAYSYGAHLQAYALQEAIRSLGHDARVIDYKGVGFDAPRKKDLFPFLRRPWRLPDAINQYRTKKGFLAFAKWQHRTAHYSSYQDLMQNPPDFDAYVCGSDQVWQPKTLSDGRAIQDEFFLSFVKNGGQKIAYAPSFGTMPDDDFICNITPYVRQFDHISVREESMVGIVKGIVGLDVPSVCDPTILLGREGFEKMLPKTKTHVGAFFYPLALNLPRDKEICRSLAARFGHLEIVSRNRPLWFVGGNVAPSPIEWMQMIRDAEFVLTNSFHGTAFAILFHKPFMTLSWIKDAQNIRVKHLLDRLGLADRFFDGGSIKSFETAASAAIDWGAVDAKIFAWRGKSQEFLREAL